MAIYVMSDIHGHYSEFRKMLEEIHFNENDILYIIGDLMDRGKENLKVIDFVMSHKNIEVIKGNHEDLLLKSYRGNDKRWNFSCWQYNGGVETLREIDNISKEKLEEYLRYIESLPFYKWIELNEKKYLLVHAGLEFYENEDLEKTIENQEENALWIRNDFLNSEVETPYIIIFGHTPTVSIVHRCTLEKEQFKAGMYSKMIKWKNKIAIDCGCARDLQLGCLRLDDMKEFYVKCKM